MPCKPCDYYKNPTNVEEYRHLPMEQRRDWLHLQQHRAECPPPGVMTFHIEGQILAQRLLELEERMAKADDVGTELAGLIAIHSGWGREYVNDLLKRAHEELGWPPGDDGP